MRDRGGGEALTPRGGRGEGGERRAPAAAAAAAEAASAEAFELDEPGTEQTREAEPRRKGRGVVRGARAGARAGARTGGRLRAGGGASSVSAASAGGAPRAPESLSARVGGMDEMDLANAITIAVRTMPRGPGKRINPATASAADLENVLRHLQRQHGVSLGVPAARASGGGGAPSLLPVVSRAVLRCGFGGSTHCVGARWTSRRTRGRCTRSSRDRRISRRRRRGRRPRPQSRVPSPRAPERRVSWSPAWRCSWKASRRGRTERNARGGGGVRGGKRAVPGEDDGDRRGALPSPGERARRVSEGKTAGAAAADAADNAPVDVVDLSSPEIDAGGRRSRARG